MTSMSQPRHHHHLHQAHHPAYYHHHHHHHTASTMTTSSWPSQAVSPAGAAGPVGHLHHSLVYQSYSAAAATNQTSDPQQHQQSTPPLPLSGATSSSLATTTTTSATSSATGTPPTAIASDLSLASETTTTTTTTTSTNQTRQSRSSPPPPPPPPTKGTPQSHSIFQQVGGGSGSGSGGGGGGGGGSPVVSTPKQLANYPSHMYQECIFFAGQNNNPSVTSPSAHQENQHQNQYYASNEQAQAAVQPQANVYASQRQADYYHHSPEPLASATRSTSWTTSVSPAISTVAPSPPLSRAHHLLASSQHPTPNNHTHNNHQHHNQLHHLNTTTHQVHAHQFHQMAAATQQPAHHLQQAHHHQLHHPSHAQSISPYATQAVSSTACADSGAALFYGAAAPSQFMPQQQQQQQQQQHQHQHQHQQHQHQHQHQQHVTHQMHQQSSAAHSRLSGGEQAQHYQTAHHHHHHHHQHQQQQHTTNPIHHQQQHYHSHAHPHLQLHPHPHPNPHHNQHQNITGGSGAQVHSPIGAHQQLHHRLQYENQNEQQQHEQQHQNHMAHVHLTQQQRLNNSDAELYAQHSQYYGQQQQYQQHQAVYQTPSHLRHAEGGTSMVQQQHQQHQKQQQQQQHEPNGRSPSVLVGSMQKLLHYPAATVGTRQLAGVQPQQVSRANYSPSSSSMASSTSYPKTTATFELAVSQTHHQVANFAVISSSERHQVTPQSDAKQESDCNATDPLGQSVVTKAAISDEKPTAGSGEVQRALSLTPGSESPPSSKQEGQDSGGASPRDESQLSQLRQQCANILGEQQRRGAGALLIESLKSTSGGESNSISTNNNNNNNNNNPTAQQTNSTGSTNNNGNNGSGLTQGPPNNAGGLQNGRSKRLRTSFKHNQLKEMKRWFSKNQNPDAKDLKTLAQTTGLTKRVLQVWFQNARAKFRRNNAKANLYNNVVNQHTSHLLQFQQSAQPQHHHPVAANNQHPHSQMQHPPLHTYQHNNLSGLHHSQALRQHPTSALVSKLNGHIS